MELLDRTIPQLQPCDEAGYRCLCCEEVIQSIGSNKRNKQPQIYSSTPSIQRAYYSTVGEIEQHTSPETLYKTSTAHLISCLPTKSAEVSIFEQWISRYKKGMSENMYEREAFAATRNGMEKIWHRWEGMAQCEVFEAKPAPNNAPRNMPININPNSQLPLITQ